jgi:hypothetical protein
MCRRSSLSLCFTVFLQASFQAIIQVVRSFEDNDQLFDNPLPILTKPSDNYWEKSSPTQTRRSISSHLFCPPNIANSFPETAATVSKNLRRIIILSRLMACALVQRLYSSRHMTRDDRLPSPLLPLFFFLRHLLVEDLR